MLFISDISLADSANSNQIRSLGTVYCSKCCYDTIREISKGEELTVRTAIHIHCCEESHLFICTSEGFKAMSSINVF